MYGLSPQKMYERVNLTVVGQTEAKKVVCNALFLHFVRYVQSTKEDRPMAKSNVLLMGPSGCGKTYLVREAARSIREITGWEICPVLEVDCTELSSRGWVGDNISDVIKSHHKSLAMEHAETNEATFNSTIVFLDEFDKLCTPMFGNKGEDHNRNTQYNLLKMLEGCELSMGEKGGSGQKIYTHKMLFIMAGNFSDVRAARKLKNKKIGFVGVSKNDDIPDIHSELEKAGMATQLVGRTPFMGEIYDLEPDDLRQILDRFAIPELEETWKFLGEELKVSEEAKDDIVAKCFKRKTGARGLQTDLAAYVADDLFTIEFRG